MQIAVEPRGHHLHPRRMYRGNLASSAHDTHTIECPIYTETMTLSTRWCERKHRSS